MKKRTYKRSNWHQFKQLYANVTVINRVAGVQGRNVIVGISTVEQSDAFTGIHSSFFMWAPVILFQLFEHI